MKSVGGGRLAENVTPALIIAGVCVGASLVYYLLVLVKRVSYFKNPVKGVLVATATLGLKDSP